MKLPITPVSIMNFFFMLGVTVILAVQQDLFKTGTTGIYPFLEAILPQEGYALAAFTTVVILFTAFILRNRYIELVGLFFSGIFVLFVLCGYLTSFPNIASVTYAVWTMASFMTMVGVLNDIQDEKERKLMIIEKERSIQATQLEQLSRDSTRQEEREVERVEREKDDAP